MKTKKLTAAAVITLLMVQQAFAPVNVSIGNGTQQVNGTYLNAQKMANNLTVTSVAVQATTNINIVDNIDLSVASEIYTNYGPPHFDLSIVTPTINLTNDILFGAGALYLIAQTVNLNGTVTATNGTLLSAPPIIGAATQVNVLSDAASLQQAFDVASPTNPVTIQVSPGQYPGDLAVNNQQVTLLLPATTNGEPVINATNLIVGSEPSVATNVLTIIGGVLYVTNAPATGVLDVRNGTLTFSNVTAAVDNLLLTNGAFSTMIFSSGSLQAGSTTVSNGQPFIIGDGTDTANYIMQGGTHSFNDGLVVTNNSMLSGCGTVNGAVTNYGTIYLNNGCDMYFNGPVVNYGKIISAANATPYFTGGLVDYTAPRSIPVLTSDGGLAVVGGEFTFTVAWNTNQVVVVLTSTDLQNWTPVQTNTMTTPYFQITIPATNGPDATFFQVQAIVTVPGG